MHASWEQVPGTERRYGMALAEEVVDIVDTAAGGMPAGKHANDMKAAP